MTNTLQFRETWREYTEPSRLPGSICESNAIMAIEPQQHGCWLNRVSSSGVEINAYLRLQLFLTAFTDFYEWCFRFRKQIIVSRSCKILAKRSQSHDMGQP